MAKGDFYRPFINKEDGNSTKEIQNCHHILPTSRQWSNYYNNKIMLYQSVHDALHRMYGNATPREQLLQLLFINSKALSAEFKSDILKVLEETDDEYYYENWVLKPRK